ncbi:hypothetical protein [Luteococcus peritonei]|uniref:Aminoglycoside phosphotransferase domain-containing protein n=1 Tax=Luteococcus peritonei TaxID=88874 RepID=A0ABW4RWS2_9ACTN
MDLEDLEWGDVLADTGEVLVCEALFGEDRVVVKRWRGTALAAELQARRLVGAAGPAQPDLLGGGEGWLVLEDLSESMWRPATGSDLADPSTLRALARWYVSIHELAPAGLPDPVTDLSGLGEVLDGLLPPDLAAPLADRLGQWSMLVAHQPRSLVVGSFDLPAVQVVGAGMDAMLTDLSVAHAGIREEDLVLVRAELDDAGWQHFHQEYAEVSSRPLDEQVWLAQRGIGEVFGLLASVLQGRRPDEARVARLQQLLA